MQFEQLSGKPTQLIDWGKTRSTVLGSDTLVVYGRETEQTPPGLYVYDLASVASVASVASGIQFKQRWDHVCQHEEEIKLLGLTIKGQQYILVACWNDECEKIYALRVRDGEVSVAYHRDGHYATNMCTGEAGIIYMHNRIAGDDMPVLELDCSSLPFIHTRTIQSGMVNMYDMKYSSHPQPMLIFTGPPIHTIRAVSVGGGEPLWELTGDVAGMPCEPHGIAITTQGQVIIADGDNNRLLVLRGRDGKVINTHHIDNCGVACNPFLINNDQQLVIRGVYSGKQWIYLFQIK